MALIMIIKVKLDVNRNLETSVKRECQWLKVRINGRFKR